MIPGISSSKSLSTTQQNGTAGAALPHPRPRQVSKPTAATCLKIPLSPGHRTVDTDGPPPADQILNLESVPSDEAEAEFKR